MLWKMFKKELTGSDNKKINIKPTQYSFCIKKHQDPQYLK